VKPPHEEWTLDTCHIGRRVLVYEQTDSTNNRAAELAGDAGNDGLVVLAREQTVGRGQYGRTWQAPAGSSVLLSVLLFPPPPLRRPALLTAWAAVSVCETILAVTGLQARIKWPNDVLLHGRKVCGILIEQGRGTVVGVGLNVRQTAEEFVAAKLPFATSLGQHTSVALDTHSVARTLLDVLDEEYARLRGGDLATLEACWKGHLGLLGKEVRAECLDGQRPGRILEIAFDGLVLRQAGGECVLPPECILHLTEY
jgi:BirA family transcriptional regulator, biotin operon repressor / biotin---[acetyl-CoA-carboxylase] ligase